VSTGTTDGAGRGRTEAITRSRLAADFRRIGLVAGDLVSLGVSLRRVGWLTPGPATFIDALLDVLGNQGTLLISCASRSFSLRALRAGEIEEVFDPHSTPSLTGLIPELVRSHHRAVRSRHPCNSVASIGAHAESLAASHDESAASYAPYRVLADLGGKFLGVGIGDRAVGIWHEAQAQAGLLGLVPAALGARYRDGGGVIRIFEWHDIGGCVRRLPELVEALRQTGLVEDGLVGAAPSVLLRARPAIDEMAQMLRADPARNQCGDRSCPWCSALEVVLAPRSAAGGGADAG
jgi:aminoglycoside N3'-acetyltransferase